MNLQEFPAYLFRWLEFLAVLVFAGNALFRSLVFAHVLKQPFVTLREGEILSEAVRGFDRRLYVAALAVLTLATPLDFFLRAARFMEDNDRLSIFTVIAHTHIGQVWLLMTLLLMTGWAGLILRPANSHDGLPQKILLPTTAALWILALSLSGHAADDGVLSPAMAADILHVTAACAWTGGLLPLVQTLRLARRRLVGETARLVFAAILERFSLVATVSVGAILISGVFMAWLRLPDAPHLPGNLYGSTFLLKMGLCAVILGLGGMNKLYMLPRLKLTAMEEKGAAEAAGESLHRRTIVFLTAEALLATAVLGCAALLAQSSAD